MATNRPLPGYPSPGARNKEIEVFEIVGPNPYVPATGQVLRASDFGFGGFDAVHCIGFTHSGTYFGFTQYLPVDPAPSINKGAVPQVAIHWYSFAGGEAGAINLSGEVMRLLVIAV